VYVNVHTAATIHQHEFITHHLLHHTAHNTAAAPPLLHLIMALTMTATDRQQQTWCC
jgi:hypothetical protein